MKIIMSSTYWIFCLGLMAYWSPAIAELQASISDPTWDGIKVPNGQQCQKFGGENPMTPEIKITGIPEGAEAIILRFNDESYQPMNNGGHGQIGILIEPGTTEIVFPSIPGHTFDIPEGIIMVSAHKAPYRDKAGAYMPPCSGGRSNKYTVTVQPSKIINLKKKKFKKIKRLKLDMGRY